MELWKKKHGARHWLENGAVEAMASQPDPSGIMFSNISHSNSEKASDSNEKLTMDGTAGKEAKSLGPLGFPIVFL